MNKIGTLTENRPSALAARETQITCWKMTETQSSPELTAITDRWINALAVCDPDTIQNLFSTSVPPLYCGTDLGEVWSGKFLIDNYPIHMADAPKGGYVLDGITTAYETHPGIAGWSFWEGNLQIPSTARSVYVRVTLVFSCFKGMWAVTHAHCSNPAPNALNYGWEHGSMNAILAELHQQGFDLDRSGVSTVMFTDVANSTVLNQTLGDIQWTRLIRSHLNEVAEIIEKEGGTFIKSLGDGTMSVFSDLQCAISAAGAVQRSLNNQQFELPIGVRIGLHTGNIVQSDNDYFGTVVNTAARITAAAGSGEIRLSSTSKELLSPEVIVDDPVTLHLNGLDGEFTLFRLVLD